VLSKAKVAKFEVSGFIQKEIFRLKIAVYDVVRVKVLENENNAGGTG
jgi:hypothetical protein